MNAQDKETLRHALLVAAGFIRLRSGYGNKEAEEILTTLGAAIHIVEAKGDL